MRDYPIEGSILVQIFDDVPFVLARICDVFILGMQGVNTTNIVSKVGNRDRLKTRSSSLIARHLKDELVSYIQIVQIFVDKPHGKDLVMMVG